MKKELNRSNLIALVAIIIGLVWLAMPAAQAQTIFLNYGYVSKRAGGAVTNAEVIFPAADQRIIRLTSYDVTGDHANCILRLQGGTYYSLISSNQITTDTNLWLSANLYIVTGDTIVVQKTSGASRGQTFSALVDSTNLMKLGFATQLGVAVAAGDKVYRMANLGTNTIGSATVRKDGVAIWASQISTPLRLFSYGSTTATAINSATAHYSTAD